MKPIKLTKDAYSKEEVEQLLAVVVMNKLEEDMIRLESETCDLSRLKSLVDGFNYQK